MEEFLTKINIVNKNNQIKKLERQNKNAENRIERYVNNFKNTITEMEIEKRQNIKLIEKLTEDNKKLQEENKGYNYMLNKIPNWVIKLFVGRNKNIGGYLYGKK